MLVLAFCTTHLYAQQVLLEPPEPGNDIRLSEAIPDTAAMPIELSVARLLTPETTSIADAVHEEPGPYYELADLEGLAVSANPALAEAISRIQAAKGRALQVGLPPNPTVGYVANEIGNEGSAGQHGAYWSRTFIRGNKLEWNRAVECREVHRLEQTYHVLRERILTDVRTHFYEILVLQQRVALLNRMLETNNNATAIAKRLFQAGENTRNDVLLLELEAEQTSTDLSLIHI